jgi:rhodanese-related sulfurtransferase
MPNLQWECTGLLTAAEGWKFLEEDAEALLIDVRTIAEWIYVGLPDLSQLGRTVVCVQWKQWPNMDVNPDFLPHLEAEGVSRDRSLLLICRSGVRSRDAAVALTSAGFGPCYNISDGFEGDEGRRPALDSAIVISRLVDNDPFDGARRTGAGGRTGAAHGLGRIPRRADARTVAPPFFQSTNSRRATSIGILSLYRNNPAD